MTNTISSIIIIFKTVHFNAFSSRLLKIKMFIIQINNKITDVAETTEN